jgi:hypothetical protein
MPCPDYYQLADSDGREFWEFYRDECTPIVADKLNDGEKHALQSACERLFRRGLKGDEAEDLQKYRWWLSKLITGFQPDNSEETPSDYKAAVERAIVPVLALVELRRTQKIGVWAEFGPRSSLEHITTVWGPVETKSVPVPDYWHTVETHKP